jgi:hypothetical protein
MHYRFLHCLFVMLLALDAAGPAFGRLGGLESTID